jgi:hypothetical protein
MLCPMLGFAAAALMSTPAIADDCHFNLSGSTSATFTINCSPVPNAYSGDSVNGAFEVDSVPGTLNGSPTTFDYFVFDTSTENWDFGFGDGSLIGSFQGPQLFTGSPSSPTFTPGDYTFSNDLGSYTLTIGAVSAVPEPSSWAMMLLGFLAISVAVRGRRRPMALAASA